MLLDEYAAHGAVPTRIAPRGRRAGQGPEEQEVDEYVAHVR